MRKLLIGMAYGMVLLGISGLAQADEYTISISTDEATRGDLDLVAGSIESAADGDRASRSLRGIAATAVGEVNNGLRARITDGVLTMDDGSTVLLLDGDTIRTETSMTGGGMNAGVVEFRVVINPGGRTMLIPGEICVPTVAGMKKCIQLPSGKFCDPTGESCL